jgi:pimeloyl-ACP methyl ester carboxylesterase
VRGEIEATVEAAGEWVHVFECGPPDGPPVLVGSGLGGAWFDWRGTVDLLRNRHRVTVFDRPGLGLSPPARRPPSLRRDVATLAALAQRAAAPVTVVTHSLGALHAEALARTHPQVVRAMVLVDPSYEREGSHRGARIAALVTPAAQAAGAVVGATRIPRLVSPLGRRLALRRLSRRQVPVPDATVRSVYGRGTVLGTILAEEIAYRESVADLADLRHRAPFPPIPLVVLTALGDLRDEADRRRWREGHQVLARMSPLGRQVEFPDALHMIQIERPEAVAAAVSQVLEPR